MLAERLAEVFASAWGSGSKEQKMSIVHFEQGLRLRYPPEENDDQSRRNDLPYEEQSKHAKIIQLESLQQ